MTSPGRERLCAAGRVVPFWRGEHLIVAGAVSDEVLLIESGLVKVVLAAADGNEPIVGFLGGGDLVGELGVLWAQPRSAHIVALTPGRAVHLAGRLFLRLRGEHPDVLDVVDQAWHKRQRRTDDWQLALTHDVTSRLAMSLLRWARDLGESTNRGLVMRGISQRDIAQAIAASEKSVEAALRVLRAAQLIKTWRLSYLIFEPTMLEAAIVRAAWRSARSP